MALPRTLLVLVGNKLLSSSPPTRTRSPWRPAASSSRLSPYARPRWCATRSTTSPPRCEGDRRSDPSARVIVGRGNRPDPRRSHPRVVARALGRELVEDPAAVYGHVQSVVARMHATSCTTRRRFRRMKGLARMAAGLGTTGAAWPRRWPSSWVRRRPGGWGWGNPGRRAPSRSSRPPRGAPRVRRRARGGADPRIFLRQPRPGRGRGSLPRAVEPASPRRWSGWRRSTPTWRPAPTPSRSSGRDLVIRLQNRRGRGTPRQLPVGG